MKVVHVIVGLNVGGAEHMLRRLVLAQREAEPALESIVVSLTDVGSVGAMLQQAGVQVVALGMRTPLSLPLAGLGLWRHLRRWRPDVVQTWMVHADLLGGLAARAAGIRAVIWGLRTTEFSTNPPLTRAIRRLCACLSHRVPHLIVSAAEASRHAHEQLGYDRRRMVVVPNGFDLVALRPAAGARERLRRQYGIADDEVVVGGVGRDNPAKDFAGFIAAAAIAARQRQCRFLLVGRGLDGGNTKLAAAIAATGCGERFVLAGEQSRVPDFMSAMDVFVLPSRSEGFPNVVGEAMAVGLPCVVTDVGDAARLLGGTGIVVPRLDPAALASAIVAMIDRGDAGRRALGAQAAGRIAAEFSLERARERFSALQQQAVRETAVAGA